VGLDEWIQRVFVDRGPGVAALGPQQCGVRLPVGPSRDLLAVRYLTALFREPALLLGGLSDDDVGRGLANLLEGDARSDVCALACPDVPIDERRECVLAVTHLFCDYLGPKLAAMRARGEITIGFAEILEVCSSWWEVWPLRYDESRGPAELDRAALVVMAAQLRSGIEDCVESALKGLGYWQWEYETEVRSLLNEYLAAHTRLSFSVQFLLFEGFGLTGAPAR
jgi:hypothetical protein